MRLDLGLWLAAAALLLAGGVLHLHRARLPDGKDGQGRRPVRADLPAYLALAGTVAGLAWQAWLTRTWPGDSAPDALLMLACGSLLLALWPRRSHPPVVAGAELFGAGFLILGATIAGWTAPLPPSIPQAGTWLFGLRGILAYLGLGAWVQVGSAGLLGLRMALQQAAADAAPFEPPQAALRVAYPCLTAALLAGAAWDLAVYAVPWRGVPAELWLTVAWLLGGLYWLVLPGGRSGRLQAWGRAGLAAAGLAAALFSAGQTSTLFR